MVKIFGIRIDRKPTLEGMLKRGYFPQELPPIFDCTTFAEAAVNSGIDFSESNHRTTPILFRLARVGQPHRLLGIPNPCSYAPLSYQVVTYWGDFCKKIPKKIRGKAVSQPYVQPPKADREIAPHYKRRGLVHHKAKMGVRLHGRFMLKTDISKFYPTIYTHSLEWVMEGKEVAKKLKQHEKENYLGCRFDKRLRDCQNSQTNGVLIGPDASFLAAELLMAQVDDFLCGHEKVAAYFRNYDDMEIVTQTEENALSLRADLVAFLESYNLSLNEAKTEIVALPVPYDDEWVTQLRQFNITGKEECSVSDQAYSLTDYFNTAFALAKKNPKQNVLGYALSKVANQDADIYEDNAEIVAQFALQAVLSEPGCLRSGLNVMLKLKDILPSTAELCTFTLCKLIQVHAPLNHSSEVLWALHGLALLDIKAVDEQTLKALAQSRDCLVMVLVLAMKDKGFFEGIDLSGWKDYVTEPDAYPEYWLLWYEGAVKGWFGANLNTIPASYALLSHIGNEGVSFLTPTQCI